jgi:hypothetical protein
MSIRATARTPARPATGRAAAPPRAASPQRAATPRPELRLVPGAAPARPRRQVAQSLRNRRAPFVLLVVALLVGTTLGLLILNTAIAVDSLKATQLRTDNAQRAKDLQRLEQQVVSGSTPAEIARAAEAAGLVPAGSAAYLVIDPEGGSVLRGTPEPAQGTDDETADDETSDEVTSDEVTSDVETSDEATSDETSDEATSDVETSDEVTSDEATSDEATSDDETSDVEDGD